MFNISHINVLSSSDRSYPFSFYFCKYVSFMYSVYNDIFHVNNVTSVFDSNLYTGLLDNDNKFFTVFFKVTMDSITLFQQENKFKVYKIFITFKVYITFFDLVFLAESKISAKGYAISLSYLVFDSFFKIPNQGWFSFQFFTLTKISQK